MSYPFCARCGQDKLPGVGCWCRTADELDAAAWADYEAEQGRWAQLSAAEAGYQASLSADAIGDMEHERARARSGEAEQNRRDHSRDGRE